MKPSGSAVALTFGERVYLVATELLIPAMAEQLREVMVHELWHLRQFRRLKGRYLERYSELLVTHGYAAHPTEAEANAQAIKGRRAMAAASANGDVARTPCVR